MKKLGVCYYPEQWDKKHWVQDAENMHQLGIKYVRIAEFAWSKLEPKDGIFNWQWLDDIIQILTKQNLSIILSTPTAAPPKWLINKYPEILAQDVSGRIRKFGSRKHYCFSSDVYRKEASRITTILAQRYGSNPAIKAWQIDNEYGWANSTFSYSVASQKRFRQWLQNKYQSIDNLNQRWGNAFWSMDYASFDDIDLPNQTAIDESNPIHQLEFKRFSSDMVKEFNYQQVKIIKKFAPTVDVLHNFMGLFNDFDCFELSQDLDIAAWDNYPLGHLENGPYTQDDKLYYLETGHPDFAAFHHDLYRACGKGRMLVQEQQPGPVNWGNNNPIPKKGMVRLWTFEAFAHGAEIVSYFRWRQLPFAQEQMHTGLQLVNGDKAPVWHEIEQISQQLPIIQKLLANQDKQPHKLEIALLFDYETSWQWEIQPHADNFNYPNVVNQWYQALRQLGLSVDIVSKSDNYQQYKIVFIPCVMNLNEQTLQQLDNANCLCIFGARSGSKTQDFSIPKSLPPNNLQKYLPIKVSQVGSYPDSYNLKINNKICTYNVNIWSEQIDSKLTPIWSFNDEYGAIFRKENWVYLGANLHINALKNLFQLLLSEQNIDYINLDKGLRMRQYGHLIFIFNYANKSQKMTITNANLVFGKTEIATADFSIWLLNTDKVKSE